MVITVWIVLMLFVSEISLCYQLDLIKISSQGAGWKSGKKLFKRHVIKD